MSNRDKPAFPYESHITGVDPRGLTKREYAAIHILAGMMANEARSHKTLTREELAVNAVKNADALFAMLGAKPRGKSDVE